MSDIDKTRQLAITIGYRFRDCGNGHLQIEGNGHLVNYYPDSKRKTAYSPSTGEKRHYCLPSDVIAMLSQAAKIQSRINAPSPAQAATSKDFPGTNPADLRHFYSGDEPPWEGQGFEFRSRSDELRHEAYQLSEKAKALIVEANEIDDKIRASKGQ